MPLAILDIFAVPLALMLMTACAISLMRALFSSGSSTNNPRESFVNLLTNALVFYVIILTLSTYYTWNLFFLLYFCHVLRCLDKSEELKNEQ